MTGSLALEGLAHRARRGSRARPAACRPRWRWMPTRCSAESAFGDSVATRPSASSDHHAVADPRRGARVGDAAPGTGTSPRRSSPAKRSKIDDVGALELAGRRGPLRCTTRGSARRSMLAVAAHRDGQHPRRLGEVLDRRRRPRDLARRERRRQHRPLARRWRTCRPSRCGTWSGRWPGGPGRRSASGRPSVGTYSSRSAKQRSASMPHSDVRRLQVDDLLDGRACVSRGRVRRGRPWRRVCPIRSVHGRCPTSMRQRAQVARRVSSRPPRSWTSLVERRRRRARAAPAAASSARRSASRVATSATSWKRSATSASTRARPAVRRRRPRRSLAHRGDERGALGGLAAVGGRSWRPPADVSVRRQSCGWRRSPPSWYVARRRSSRARYAGLVRRRRLQRRHDDERRARVDEQRLDLAGPGDEALLHRLEEHEELGDVLQEPRARAPGRRPGRTASTPR